MSKKKKRLFACYRGDVFIFVGTKPEILNKLGLTANAFDTAKSRPRRLEIIEILFEPEEINELFWEGE